MKSIQHTKIRLISFDLDNALYDNLPVMERAEKLLSGFLMQAFAQQSKPFDFADFIAVKHQLLNSTDSVYENMSLLRLAALQQFCASLENSEALVNQAFNLFMSARSEVMISVEMQQMLEELSQNFTLVTVSNGNCNIKLSSIGRLFSKNYDPTMGFRAKPNPQMLQQILLDYHLTPTQVLHVGDSPESDGMAAQLAGVEFCHFAPFAGSNNFQFYQSRLFACLTLNE